MRNPGRLFAPVKTPNKIPYPSIRCREALPLAQILEPRLRDEGLIQMTRVGCILVDAPANGSIPQPHVSQLVDGLGKGSIVQGIDMIVDRHADWSLVVLPLLRQLGRR